jgi:hypothetical protein
MKGTLLVEENTFTTMSRLPLEGFYESPNLTLHAYCQQTVSVWLQSANNEGHFTCRRKYLQSNVSASIGGILLKSTPNTACILPTKDISLVAVSQ